MAFVRSASVYIVIRKQYGNPTRVQREGELIHSASVRLEGKQRINLARQGQTPADVQHGESPLRLKSCRESIVRTLPRQLLRHEGQSGSSRQVDAAFASEAPRGLEEQTLRDD